MVRRDFTESDDDNLMKYIAKVKPTNFGRQGNNIYISLEQSVDLRPWAKRHSWQSWRERYRKNQDWFNHHIKKYQKNLKGASEKKKDDQGELYKELFGISQFSDDGEDELDVHKNSIAPSSFDDVVKIEAAPILPPVQEPASKPVISSEQKSSASTALKLPQVSEDGGDETDVHKKFLTPSSNDMVKNSPAHEPTSKPAVSFEQKPSATAAEIALKPSQRTPSKSKKIASRDDDSNFFGTPSPSPSLPAANSTSPRGNPPILTQGFYRSSLKRPRAAFGNVTNDESWPPKRRKKMEKDVEMSDSCDKVETNKAVYTSLPPEGSANGLTQVRPPTQVNAVASSSKVLLSDPPHRPAKPTNLLKVIYAKGNPSSDTSHVHTDAPLSKKPIQNSKLPLVKMNHNGVAGSSSQNPWPNKSVQRLISSPDDDVDHQLARLSSVDIDDPFITNKYNTTTSPVRNLILPPRRIDLRKSLDNATRSRRSRTSTTTSSTSRHSNPSFLLPEDREIFNQVGLQKVMAVIAKNYGFDVDVATKAFFATKSIEKTKSLLQFAKEVTNSATSALLSELVNDDGIDSSDDDNEETPQHMRRGHNNSSPLSSGKDHHQRSDALTNSGLQKSKRSSGASRRKSNRFSIKPRPLDEEIDEMVLSDYSPPRVSRAGQFSRLVKEGRREEAVDRERRRASGAFVAQTQSQAQRYDDEDQPQQPSLTSSSTLDSVQKEPAIDNIDTQNVEPPTVAPHEDIIVQQHHDQPPDDNILLATVDDDDQHDHQHHRIFLKRISEGQSSLNEAEDDPEILKLAMEHRDLVMDVTEDNADALRSFEQKHNQDLLRLWSLDWVRQKIANF